MISGKFLTGEAFDIIAREVEKELREFDNTPSERVGFGISVVGGWKNASRSPEGGIILGRRKKTITITIEETD